MRRTLLLTCAIALAGTVAVVAFAAESPLAERPRGSAPVAEQAPAPESGPFALAASRAQASGAEHDHGYRHRSGHRGRLVARIADRLGVSRHRMWRSVADVRRQISPREWSDARDEALRMLSRELELPLTQVRRAVQIELRRSFG